MIKTVAFSKEPIVISRNNVVTKSEHLYYYQPKTKFKGDPINWYDDSKLIRE